LPQAARPKANIKASKSRAGDGLIECEKRRMVVYLLKSSAKDSGEILNVALQGRSAVPAHADGGCVKVWWRWTLMDNYDVSFHKGVTEMPRWSVLFDSDNSAYLYMSDDFQLLCIFTASNTG
jgi:hypothetical protein